MNKKENYYLASLLMSDLADSLKEGSQILMENSDGIQINDSTMKDIERIRKDLGQTLPENRWKYIKRLVNEGDFHIRLIKTRNSISPTKINKKRKIDLILDLQSQGKNQSEIAKELGCTRSNISLALKRYKQKN